MRVNIKSLAAESRIIRQEIQRTTDSLSVNSLHYHRVNIVRVESRAAQLLYAFVRGLPYVAVEQKTNFCDYDRRRLLASVKGKAKRHGIDITEFGGWMN